ncbi:MAG: 5-amino-6-(D-ribitylamino)uracil--L-tyrosine 4-hydroxyphenyl transferase CofH [Proteobacteria bacterium]|nr:5-amino-6-(D-ribitylamino)uracil--L-tyrosine 4-hydroxyphenyl transferase CofH [Pseudomonadota bacterium]
MSTEYREPATTGQTLVNGIDACLSAVGREVRRILDGCLQGRPLDWRDGVTLLGARGRDLHAVCLAADHMRAEQAGDKVTYVINRNINFTNVCVKNCKFCAFSRDLRSEQGYFLSTEEVVRRAVEAREMGATEVCIQAGLAPTADGRIYVDICRAVKRAVPDLHLHAFSPEEVKYGALRSRMSIRDYLVELKEAGLGSLPGTSAEILDDQMRERISPGRITTAQWIEVITTAHEIGLPTTSTTMFGHVESAADRMRHMDLLRSIQADTGGFTEFVPLSFVHREAPMFARAEVAGVRPGPGGDDVIAMYAVARLMLGPTFRNIQASWVKEGLRMSQWLLSCGVNDVGGTLINESISTSAGASHGQLISPAELRQLISDAGRIPAQRDTRYTILRQFDPDGDAADAGDPLDGISDGDERFGSYRALTRDERFRYHFTGVERGGAKSGDGTSRLYRVAKTQKTSKTP